MNRELIIRIDGTLALDNRISIRTLSHTLPHFQRAIDKIVLFEKYGELSKNAALGKSLYQEADLYLEQFEEGSVKIPLVGNLLEGVGKRINSFLKEPYEKAANNAQVEYGSYSEQLQNTLINIKNDNIEDISQEDLIKGARRLKHSYAQAAVANDLNKMLSPLRSEKCKNDSIDIINNTAGNTATYSFDSSTAKSFSQIVTQKRLAKPVRYVGRLRQLGHHSSQNFPCKGTFVSSLTGEEMSLLFTDKDEALKLSAYNMQDVTIEIWACPLAIYESFDHHRGDIVFASFIRVCDD